MSCRVLYRTLKLGIDVARGGGEGRGSKTYFAFTLLARTWELSATCSKLSLDFPSSVSLLRDIVGSSDTCV